MKEETCKHEWVGEAWKPEVQSCKKCHIAWYEAYPRVEHRTETAEEKFFRSPAYTLSLSRIDTGWSCSITGCYEVARVSTSGFKMCEKHADRWDHGMGETIKEIQESEAKRA